MSEILMNNNKLLVDSSRNLLTINKASIDINGLIKEYKVLAGETINAGDFIEFITNITKQFDTYVPSYSCIRLDPNRIFIVHRDSNLCFLGTIITINGLEMTTVTNTINNEANSFYYGTSSMVLLEPNKIFVTHSYSTNRNLCGTIVTINGTEMTAVSTVLNNETSSIYTGSNCILLEPNKVFIAHQYSTNFYLYGTIVTINGTEMTAVSTILDSNKCSNIPKCVLLNSNKILIAYGYGNSNYLRITLVNINDNTMTGKNITIDSSVSNTCYDSPNCILLEPNKVFIAHEYSYSSHLYGTIITIDGDKITSVSHKLSNSSSSTAVNTPSCFLIEQNKIIIFHIAYIEPDYYLCYTTVTINGTEITYTTSPINNIQLKYNSYVPQCILLDSNTFFIARSTDTDNYLFGTLFFGAYVKKYTETIHGIAKTSGTGGDTIQVYVPNKE